MEFLGLILTFSGGLLSYCGFTGRNPFTVIGSVATGNPFPPRDSWQSIASPQVVNDAASNAVGAVLGATGSVPGAGATGAANAVAAGAASLTNSGTLNPLRAAVVAYAKRQLGKPYVFDTPVNAANTNSATFDCSGLTMEAYRVVGINLPHLAAGQQKYGKAVSLAQAQPGDLVFWNTPASHVGIYVGNGEVIDAPHTGSHVQQQKVWDVGAITVRSLLPTSSGGTATGSPKAGL